MRITLALLLLLAMCSVSFAAASAMPIIVKAGLAGGAFRIAGVLEKPINDKMSLSGDVGYGIGNQYTVLTAGIAGKYNIKSNIYAGLNLEYSAYSDPVKLTVGGEIKDKSALGFGVFLGMPVRESVFVQAGYDTRLGAVAEIGYTVKK